MKINWTTNDENDIGAREPFVSLIRHQSFLFDLIFISRYNIFYQYVFIFMNVFYQSVEIN